MTTIDDSQVVALVKAAEVDLRKTLLVVGLTGMTLAMTRTKEAMHRKDIDYANGIVEVLIKITSELQQTIDSLEGTYKAAMEKRAATDKGEN